MSTGKVIQTTATGGVIQSIDGKRYNFYVNQWNHPTARKPQLSALVEFDLTESGRNARRVRPLDLAALNAIELKALQAITPRPAQPMMARVPAQPPLGRWLPALMLNRRATKGRFYGRADLTPASEARLSLTRGDVVLVRFDSPLIQAAPDSTIWFIREVRALDQALATTKELREALEATPAVVKALRTTLEADLNRGSFDTAEDYELLQHLLVLADALSVEPVNAAFSVLPEFAVSLGLAKQWQYLSLESGIQFLHHQRRQLGFESLLAAAPKPISRPFFSQWVAELAALPDALILVRNALMLAKRYDTDGWSALLATVSVATGFAQYAGALWVEGIVASPPPLGVLAEILRAAVQQPFGPALPNLLARFRQADAPAALPELCAQLEVSALVAVLPVLKPHISAADWQDVLTSAVEPRVTPTLRIRLWLHDAGTQPAPEHILNELYQADLHEAYTILTHLDLTGLSCSDSFSILVQYAANLPFGEGALEQVLKFCQERSVLQLSWHEISQRLFGRLPAHEFVELWKKGVARPPSPPQLHDMLQAAPELGGRIFPLMEERLLVEYGALVSNQPALESECMPLLAFLDQLPSRTSAQQNSYGQLLDCIAPQWWFKSWLRRELRTLPWSHIAAHIPTVGPDTQREIGARTFPQHFAEMTNWLLARPKEARPPAVIAGLAEAVCSNNASILPHTPEWSDIVPFVHVAQVLVESEFSADTLLPQFVALRSQCFASYRRRTSSNYFRNAVVAPAEEGARHRLRELAAQFILPGLSPEQELEWWQAHFSEFPLIPLSTLAAFGATLTTPSLRQRLAQAAGISEYIVELWGLAGQLTNANFSANFPELASKLLPIRSGEELLAPLWPVLVAKLEPENHLQLWAAGWPGAVPTGWEFLSVPERIGVVLRHANRTTQLPEGLAPEEIEIAAWLDTCYWSMGEETEVVKLLHQLRQYSPLRPRQLPDAIEVIILLVSRCALAVKAWLWSTEHVGDEFYDYHGFRRSRSQLNPDQVRKLASRVWEHEKREFTGREPVSPRLSNTSASDGVDVYTAKPAHFLCTGPGEIVFKISNAPAVFTRPYFFEGALPKWNEAELTGTKHFVQVRVTKETLEIIDLNGLREALKPVEVGCEQKALPSTRTNEGGGSGSSGGRSYPVEAAQRSSIGQYAIALAENVQISAGIREPELIVEARQLRSVREGHSARPRTVESAQRPMGMPLTNFFTVPWGADIIVIWAGLDYSGKATYFFRAPAADQSQLLARLHYVTTNHPRLRSFLLSVGEDSSQPRQLLHRHLGFIGVLRASRQANTEASINAWQQRADLLINAGPSTTVPYNPASTWTLNDEPVTPAVAFAGAPIPEVPVPREGTDWMPTLVASLQRFNTFFLFDFPS